MIAHVDLDSFFVSCERIKDPSLIGKPVIVGGKSKRGVVASCSYEARKFGVHSAMPGSKAIRLCPQAIFVKGDMSFYALKSKQVTDIIAATVPVFEKSSIDEFYIDMSGMDKFYNPFDMLIKMREKIQRETGLPLSFGYGINKTVAKIATNKAKPDGYLKVDKGQEKLFLAPLKVNEIPMVGKKFTSTLNKAGFFYIKDIQNSNAEFLKNRFGQYGLVIWNKATGLETSEIKNFRTRKSISTEKTFHENICDLDYLKELAIAMTETLTYQLRSSKKVISTVAIKIRYDDFSTFSLQESLPPTCSDHHIFPIIKSLLQKIYKTGKEVRLLGVRLSNFSEKGIQTTIFEDIISKNKLYTAMDKLKSKHGPDKIKTAKALDMKLRNRVNPFNKD